MNNRVLVDSNIWIAKGKRNEWHPDHIPLLAPFSQYFYCEIIVNEIMMYALKHNKACRKKAEEWVNKVLNIGVGPIPGRNWERYFEKLQQRLEIIESWDFINKNKKDLKIASKAMSDRMPFVSDDSDFRIIEYVASKNFTLLSNIAKLNENQIIIYRRQLLDKGIDVEESLLLDGDITSPFL